MPNPDGSNGHAAPPLEQVRVEVADEQRDLRMESDAFMQSLDSYHRAFDGTEASGAEQAPPKGSSMVDRVDIKRAIRVTLEWRQLTYTVQLSRSRRGPPCCGPCCGRGVGDTKTILQDLSATVPPGRLLAIMGPSGCGKTSLVNALAGRLPRGGSLAGEILVNGAPRGRGFRSITGYVMQDEALFHNLTVRETFEFAAAIRLPSSVSPAAKAALVDEVLIELGLRQVEGTYIGSAFVRGVSGGERKRVNVGIQLLSNPSLLFLDEPTSGLDAFQAQNIMETLWNLARAGRSILATIHQPRSSIFRMFDLLLLLSAGRAMYFGKAAEAVAWFEAQGFPCPQHFNPADFFLDVVSASQRSPASEEAAQRRISLLAGALAKQQSAEGSQAAAVAEVDAQAMAEMDAAPGFPNSLPTEYRLLLQRAWKQQSRDKLPLIITLMQTVVIGLVLAALFSDIPNNQVGIQDETGILFFVAIFTAMSSVFGALNTFPTERNIINRERAGKSYHVLPYYMARFICDMPIRVGQGMLFGCIVYWIVGLRDTAAAFFKFVALLVLDALASQGLGVAVSAAVKTEKLAFAAAPAITIILLLFAGFIVNTDSIPVWLRWISYISHLYWAFMGLTINNFAGRTGWSCNDPSDTTCEITGDQVLDRLGFGGNEIWQPYLALCCLVLFYNVCGYLVLRFGDKPRFLPLTPAPKKGA